MRSFFFYEQNLVLKLTPIFINIGATALLTMFVGKTAISSYGITELPAVYRYFLKRAKSKKAGKIHQN